MNMGHCLFSILALGAVLTVFADEERETFGKWRIGVGGAFNSAVSADLTTHHLPVPPMYSVPAGSTRQSAWDRAVARIYDGGGYIASDDGTPLISGDTENWSLPVSSYRGNGHFVLDNAYEEIVGSCFNFNHRDLSDDERQFGISVEIARELWIRDENEEHRRGLDFVAAFSYFFQRDVYSARGTVYRTDFVKEGVIRTDVVDPDTMYDYDNGLDSAIDGMYGYGSAWREASKHPALGYDGIGDPYDVGGVPVRSVGSSSSYRASGDYRELEMLFMLRPWYELTDWWRIFAEGGLAVSWGRFESSFLSSSASADEDFAQWDCYGVAGLGTSLRYDQLTLTVDILGRFLRDDLEVDGRYINGSIDRSDWCIRVMIGYEF